MSETNSSIERAILKVSEVTKRFDLESSLTRKKPLANNEAPIERNNIAMYILKSIMPFIVISVCRIDILPV